MFPDTQSPLGNSRPQKAKVTAWRKGKGKSTAAVSSRSAMITYPQFAYADSFEPIKAISMMDQAMKKSISFRVFATIGTFTVAFVLTGNPIGSVSIATAQALTNTTIYYYHERMWNKKGNQRNAE